MAAEKKREFPLYKELAAAYDFYNAGLFGGKLPDCLITLSKNVNYNGYFMPMMAQSVEDPGKTMHEINMNMTMFALRKIELTLSTMVHEMCHMQTYENGEYGRGSYHNKQWALYMENVGLMPSDTGCQGGKKVGQSVTHYIIEGGLFDRKTKEFIKEGFILPFVERLSKEVKSYTLSEAQNMAVEGKKGFYKEKNGKEFEGKSVYCGNDDNGDEIVKIIVKEEDRLSGRKIMYQCGCGDKFWGGSALEATCNKCGGLFSNERR